MAALNKTALFRELGYEPHSEGQRRFHDCTSRFRLAACGRRYGKSTMVARDLEPRMFIPGMRYWIVGPTYDLGEKEFRVIWDDLIVKMQLGKHKGVKKAYNKKQGEMRIELPNRTIVEVRSAQHPDTLVGDNLDHVIMSEAAKHRDDTWQKYIRAALSDRRGTADFASTPEGMNWFHQMYEMGIDPGFPDYAAFHFPSWENPIVYPGGRQDPEILAIERSTSKEFFNQEIAADFGSFVGAIYTDFDKEVHVQRHTFRPEWKNYIAFDWGFTSPLAAVEFQVSPSDEMWIWREHYMSYRTVKEHCDILKRREQPTGYHLDLAFGDAADPEAAAVVSRELVACVTDPMAKQNWREGIDLVASLMKSYDTGLVADEFGTPIERPHFFVDPSCKETIREHQNYRRSAKATSATKESTTTAPTNKQDDHTCDAVRYGAMHVFRLGAQHHLSDVVGEGNITDLPPRPDRFDPYEGLGVVSDFSGDSTFFTSDMGSF